MNYDKKTKDELIKLCKEAGVKGYSGKKKEELINLLTHTLSPSMPSATQDKPNNESASDSESTPTLRMVDLFAGTGAFSYAFEQTGKVKTVFANDMVDHSKKMYDANFDHSLTLQDLNSVKVEDIPAHDILTGGFPCQPFSIAGKQAGFDDARSNVFWKILEIVDHHKPRCIILENVKNLISHDNNKTFQTIRSNVEERGYHLTYKVLNTAEITGIPQHRERIYIVCCKDPSVAEQFTLDFPDVVKRPVTDMLQSDPIPQKYYYTDASSTWPLVSKDITKQGTIYQYRRVYVRENKSNECPTLTANMGSGGHNVPLIRDANGIRKLTPRECFNFQGFPSNYKLPNLSDANLYKLSGNAVSVPVVSLIANRLIPLLS
jgi:DNA (cytosine-5)-methyltransferase 1